MKGLAGKFPRYHSKDLTVMAVSMLPLSGLLNYLLYGAELIHDAWLFVGTLAVTFLYLAGVFTSCGVVAILLRNRFPTEAELVKRILISLGIFYLLSAVYIALLLLVYDVTTFFGYQYEQQHFYYAYLAAVVINTFLTFFNEAIYRFDQLKASSNRNEQLKRECLQTKILGLKSQVSPHFLFNSLNTLSSLIQEDSDRAEAFLNHMSKVYRYLLRHRDEQLVALETELAFIDSLHFMWQQRYGAGIDIRVEVASSLQEHLIAPFTLQMIIEHAISQNSVCKSTPLQVRITAAGESLLVNNSVRCRSNTSGDPLPLENIVNKYRLLSNRPVVIRDNDAWRTISIPLIAQQTANAAPAIER